MDECSRGAKGGVVAVDTEAFEIEHAEGLHHRLSACDFVEVVVWDFRNRTAVAEVGEELIELRCIGAVGPVGGGVFWHDDLAWIDAFEGGKQAFWLCLGSKYELAGGEV